MEKPVQFVIFASLALVFVLVKIDDSNSKIKPPKMTNPSLSNLIVTELPSGDWVVPPDEYQGNSSAIIHFIDFAEAPKFCGHPYAVGCQPDDARGRPNIIAPNPCEYTDQTYAAVLCHELGHVNGWIHERQGPPTYSCRTKKGELKCELD